MIDVRPTHHLAIVLGRERNVTAVVQGVQRTPSLHEAFDGCTLLLGDPGLGLLLRPVPVYFQARANIRSRWAQDIRWAKSFHPAKPQTGDRSQEARGYLIVVDGVIDAKIQLPEKPVQGDPNIIGVVITVADEGKDTSTVVIGWDSNGLFPRRAGGLPPTLVLQRSSGDFFLKWWISLNRNTIDAAACRRQADRSLARLRRSGLILYSVMDNVSAPSCRLSGS